jgi:1,4-alpha-glucan branching enzyme
MISVDYDGTVTFSIRLLGATSVELVGTLDAWHEQRIPMHHDGAGWWRLTARLGSGEHFYRFLIDGEYWLLDSSAHGTRTRSDGVEMSRVWIPPATNSPDAIAA